MEHRINRLSILKPLGAEWIESLYKYMLDNPSIVKNGLKAAGILEATTTCSENI